MSPFPEVADAEKPETPAAAVKLDGLILQNADAVGLEGGPNPRLIEPPIVVPEACPDPERRAQPSELRGGVFRRYEMPTEDSADYEVTRQKNEIGVKVVRDRDDPSELRNPIEGRTDVQIGQDRDSQSGKRFRPTGECDAMGG